MRNVRAAGAGTLGRGRSVEHVRLVELPLEERGPILRGFLQQVRGGVRFFGSADPMSSWLPLIAIRYFASSRTRPNRAGTAGRPSVENHPVAVGD